MRMTRAALRAQTHVEEDTESPNHTQTDPDLQTQSPLIHEDSTGVEAAGKPETNPCPFDDPPVRQALRDITDENYPQADGIIEISSKLEQPHELDDETAQESQKSTRKGRGKAKGRTKKKTDGPTPVEAENQQDIDQDRLTTQPDLQEQTFERDHHSKDISATVPLDQSRPSEAWEEPDLEHDLVSEPGPAIEEDLEIEQPTRETLHSRTPQFDPAIHIPDNDNTASATEDSFIRSIKSRSPAKASHLELQQLQRSDSFNSSLQAHTPLRRTSSTNFEESFEAMDSLEDNIEQLTASLPMLPGQEMHSPESPLKQDGKSLRPHADSATPDAAAAAKTPKSTSKLQAILRLQEKDKENTPPITKTPVSKAVVAPKSKTPAKQASPLKARTPAAKSLSPSKPPMASARKPGTSVKPEPTVKKSAAASPTKTTNRRSVLISNNASTKQSDGANKMAGGAAQGKVNPKKPVAHASHVRSEVLPKKPMVEAEKRAHQTSMSFSNSPAKQQQPLHMRRKTSGAILSTSKPGFVPSKSSKPPTTSNFALPGEAVAEKLKAQKEAREEKMRQPKSTLAEEKALKLKADREAREERVRLNQLKAKEAEAEKAKPARPLSTSVLTISKARAEAAERGRQASKEWAEKMMKKKQVNLPAKSQEAVGAAS